MITHAPQEIRLQARALSALKELIHAAFWLLRPRLRAHLRRALLLVALLACLTATGCKASVKSDKRTLVIFSVGPSLVFVRDADREVEGETKDSDKPADEGEE